MNRTLCTATLTIAVLLACVPLRATSAFLDTLNFGDDPAERAHALAGDRGEVVKGGLDLPARRPRSTVVLYLGK